MRKLILVAILMSLLALSAPLSLSVVEAQTGIELGTSFVMITGIYYGGHFVSQYVPELARSFQPVAATAFSGICSRLGFLGCRDPEIHTKAYLIPSDNHDIPERIREGLGDRIEEQVAEAIQALVSDWWRRWRTRVTIGVDARPTANPFSPRFTYRTYRLSDCISRWDFYPPGNWTINAWQLDVNRDGQTDIVIPSNIQTVCLK